MNDLDFPAPALSMSGAFAESTSSEEQSKRKEIFLSDQRHLYSRRTEFIAAFQKLQSQIFTVNKTYHSAILKKTHVGDWAALSPLMSTANKMNGNRRMTICLGGWRMDRESVVCATGHQPAKDLNWELLHHECHYDILRQMAVGRYGSDGKIDPRLHKLIEKYKRYFPDMIPVSSDLQLWENYCQEQCQKCVSFIEDHLQFLSERMFWFVSTPEKPEVGLEEFTMFVRRYSLLPEHVIKKFGPYYLTIIPNRSPV